MPAHLPAGAGLPEDEVGGPRRAGPGPDPGCVSPAHRSFTLATGSNRAEYGRRRALPYLSRPALWARARWLSLHVDRKIR